MNIPLTFTVAASRAFTSKDGKKYVSLEGSAIGIGIFKILVDERAVPDQLEGKTVKANFNLIVDRDFRLALRFAGIDGYAE